MRRLLFVTLVMSLLAGCGVPPTTADRPASSSPPSSTRTPAPSATATIAPPTLIPTASSAPTAEPTSLPVPPAPTATAQPLPSVVDGLITGTVMLPANIAVPADAVLHVKLVLGMRNFYYPDAANVLGEQQITLAGTQPVNFAIPYDPAAINPDLPYTVFAEVTAGGKRVLTGGEEVITQARPTTVHVALYPLPTATGVSGTLVLPADRSLPPDATVTVRLQTPTDGVGGPRVLGEFRATPTNTNPIPFSIAVDPAALDPYASYTLFATLEAPGRLLWNADEQSVLTWGNPATATLTLQAPQNTALINGNVALPNQAALPPEAELRVQIAYVYSDTIAFVEREQRITPVAGQPLSYTIEYLQGSFQPDNRYALYAFVRLHEKLLFTTPLVPLDPAAIPPTVDLQLAPPTNVQTVSGTISFDRNAPLPPDARLFVQLQNISVADGPAEIIAEQVITPVGTAPLTFAIQYDPLTIAPSGSYIVGAVIRADERELFSGVSAAVITQGAPTVVELQLSPAP